MEQKYKIAVATAKRRTLLLARQDRRRLCSMLLPKTQNVDTNGPKAATDTYRYL